MTRLSFPLRFNLHKPSLNRHIPVNINASLPAGIRPISIINQLTGETPDIINWETGTPEIDKSIMKSPPGVAKDWKKFVRYIRRQQYDKAAGYILDTDVRGHILGYLRGSILRSIFILDVVDFLLLEYHKDIYYSSCSAWMYEELQQEIIMNGITNGEPHDVAETFPKLLISGPHPNLPHFSPFLHHFQKFDADNS